MTSSDSSSPLDALLRIPAALVNELGAVFPRFADRTRAQFAFAAAVAEKLRCDDLAAALSSVQGPVAERIADVVPFDVARRAGAPRPIEFEDDGDETLIDVIVASVPPEGTAAAQAAAANEPAKKATAKKAPAKAAAKKAPAKKAPAKAAAKKTPAKTTAKKAPAKATAKKAPAKKAAAKAAAKKTPAKTTAKKAPAKATAKKAPAKKTPARAVADAASTTRTSGAKDAASTGRATHTNGLTAEIVELRQPHDSAAATPAGAVPAAASLAIPNYDALAASQVVPRLASLSPADLDAVRRYEQANRGRRTILSGIAQIQES